MPFAYVVAFAVAVVQCNRIFKKIRRLRKKRIKIKKVIKLQIEIRSEKIQGIRN